MTVRIAQTTLGIPLHQLYDRDDPEHERRLRQAIVSGDGQLYIPGAYEVIIVKVRANEGWGHPLTNRTKRIDRGC